MRHLIWKYLNGFAHRVGEAAIFGLVIGLMFLALVGEDNVSKAALLCAANGAFCAVAVAAYLAARRIVRVLRIRRSRTVQ